MEFHKMIQQAIQPSLTRRLLIASNGKSRLLRAQLAQRCPLVADDDTRAGNDTSRQPWSM